MTEQIAVVGNLNVDLVMGPQEPWPTPGTEVLLPMSDLRVGGAAGNAALALRELETPYWLVANRGDDILGRWLAEAFPDQSGLAISNAPTTISVGITHPNGERTFFTPAGHLNRYDLACVEAQLPEAAEQGAIALVVGTFVTPALLPDYPKLIASLRGRQFSVALDTGWPDGGWTEEVRSQVGSWLPACSHLLINETEALGLAGRSDLHAAAEVILPRMEPGAVLVIKRGPSGAVAFHASARVEVPAPVVTVVDTIGAGDAFNAGYLSALVRGGAPDEAVAAGVALASLAVSTMPRRYRA